MTTNRTSRSTANPSDPTKLPPNQPRQFYRGGQAIADLRGISANSTWEPEDWVASTTTKFGNETAGLSATPDGQWLRDVIAAHPDEWLGPSHYQNFGRDTALLVKLLDAGQRLPVHFHPSNSFAERYFNSHHGKTEAWIVIETRGQDPRVYVGFREEQSLETIGDWVENQDSAAMLGALNSFSVRPGDTIYIPAGLPHAIGAGVFVVELQQPTDFSLTMEWQGFLDSPKQGHLGIGFDSAIRALDRSAWGPERLANLVNHTADMSDSVVPLLPHHSAPYFQAQRIQPRVEVTLDASFAVLVVIDGQGTLRTSSGSMETLAKGDTWVIPYSTGESTVAGEVTVIRCCPPNSLSDRST